MWAIPTGASWFCLKKKKKKIVPVLSFASRKPVRIRQSGQAGIQGVTSTKGKGVSPALERQKAKLKFPRFDPSEASFDVDPPNIISKRAYKKRKGN